MYLVCCSDNKYGLRDIINREQLRKGFGSLVTDNEKKSATRGNKIIKIKDSLSLSGRLFNAL